MVTPIERTNKHRQDEILSPTSDSQPHSQPVGDQGAKSAANAELYAFYQSLIPQGCKEKEVAFNLRSKSMVTNFMDIPEH